MGQIRVTHDLNGIKGLCLIEPTVHGDARGYFYETYNQQDMAEAELSYTFVQDNQSMSTRGVLRGLHFQIKYPQTKLVRVIKGAVFDVAVDLRPNSQTYGKWHSEILSEENKRQFLIPRGFAHGFLVLSEIAEFCYKCDDFYHPNDEGGIMYNDPSIGIAWPTEGIAKLIMSEKDKKWPELSDLHTVCVAAYNGEDKDSNNAVNGGTR